MNALSPRSILPEPSVEEIEHSRAVAEHIRAQIQQAGGWISFERFMQLALYAPGLGYYSAGSTKLGAGGDFVTAPELSDLFSRCVARQCAQVLPLMGGGEILELGAGTGRMAAAILETLQSMDALPARYSILEVSADLRERQQARIAKLPASLQQRVVWLDRLPGKAMQGVVLANEVLDALPCHRFVVRADGIRALGVSIGPNGQFIEQEREAEPELVAAYERVLNDLREPLPEGYRSELCLHVEPWIASLAQCMQRGVALFFDYGLPRAHYYHPQRMEGTLRCHFKHHVHDDPLILPGIQDITAWVDFTRVAEGALAAKCDVLGFATQAAFLLGSGIASFAADVDDPVQRARFASEARQLLLPGEMGEAFKVMAIGRDFDAPLSGFVHQDLRDSL